METVSIFASNNIWDAVSDLIPLWHNIKIFLPIEWFLINSNEVFSLIKLRGRDIEPLIEKF